MERSSSHLSLLLPSPPLPFLVQTNDEATGSQLSHPLHPIHLSYPSNCSHKPTLSMIES